MRRAAFAFCGFAPGFAYLLGLDPRLHLPRHPTHQRVPDPGAGGLVAQVTDLDKMVANMRKSFATKTLTPQPVWFSDTIWDIFLEDPNGMNLELFQTIPAPKATH